MCGVCACCVVYMHMCLGHVCHVPCGGECSGYGATSVWELAIQGGALPRGAMATQYLGNHVVGRGGDVEVKNGQEKEGG